MGFKKRTYKKNNWKEKALNGKFTGQIVGIATDESQRWLRNRFVKKETEGMLLAEKEQALRTNSISQRRRNIRYATVQIVWGQP